MRRELQEKPSLGAGASRSPLAWPLGETPFPGVALGESCSLSSEGASPTAGSPRASLPWALMALVPPPPPGTLAPGDSPSCLCAPESCLQRL